MEDKGNDRANISLQFMVAGAIMFWATGFVFSVLYGIFWAIQQGAEPIEIIKSQYNWIGGAIFGYVAALVSFGFPGSVGSAKQADSLNKLIDKTPTPQNIQPVNVVNPTSEPIPTAPQDQDFEIPERVK